jgi:hypothetical protein
MAGTLIETTLANQTAQMETVVTIFQAMKLISATNAVWITAWYAQATIVNPASSAGNLMTGEQNA